MSHDIFKHLNDQFQTVFNAPDVSEDQEIIKIYKGSLPESAEDTVNESDLLAEILPMKLVGERWWLDRIEFLSQVKENDVERVADEVTEIVEREVKKAMMG